MKSKTSKTQHIPTCDTCNKPAKYESVKTVEPGPFAILWKVDGKELGLVKVEPEKCHLQRYCEEHVPNLEPRKILWMKDYAGEQDPKTTMQQDILLKQELARAAKAIGEKSGAVLKIEFDYTIGEVGIEPGHIQPIIEAVRKIYRNASVVVFKKKEMILMIGIDPVYITPVKDAIVDIDTQMSALIKLRDQRSGVKPGKHRTTKNSTFVIKQGDQILDAIKVSRASIKTIVDVIFDMTRRITIKMQHGDEVSLSSFNPRDTKKVMDAIIEICTQK